MFYRMSLWKRFYLWAWKPARLRYERELHAEIRRLVVDAPHESVEFE